MFRTLGLIVSATLLVGVFAGCLTGNNGTPSTGGTGPTTATGSTPSSSPPIQKTVAKCGNEAAYPPFEDLVDGKIVGFDADVASAISNRTPYDLQLQNAAFDSIIPSIQSGQFKCGISAFTITDERKKTDDFSVSYYDNALLVAVKSDNTNIKKASDLTGKRVCTQVGTTSEDWLRANAGATNDSMVLLDHFPPCADALKRGDVAAMIIDRAVVRGLVTNSSGTLKAAFEIPVDEQFGLAVAKGDTAFLTAINTALTTMKADGSLKKLADKWQV